MRLLPPPPEKYKAVVIGGAAFVVLLILGAIFGNRGVVDLRRLQMQQRRFEQRAFEQQQANARLREHIHRLQSDDAYLERWARHRLRWSKPGEIVYHFAEAGRPPPAAGKRQPARDQSAGR